MSGTNFEDNNQVDTFEITAIVWSHKLLIAVCVFATVIYAGFLLSGMEKKYTAIAIFRLENPSSNSSIPMSEEIGAIAALAGIKGMGSDSTDILLERMSNKEFILNVSKELSLKNDKYFNTYEPPGLESWWKAKLKSFIGKAENTRDLAQYVNAEIIDNYLDNVKVSKTENGALEISFSHKDSKQAADYANSVMQVVKNLVTIEKETATQERLSYLSETLADALQEVETSGQKLNEFLLNNNISPEESFLFSSFELDKLRVERKEVREISSVLNVIKNLINDGSMNVSTYENLRDNYPLVDDVNFRQILGMSETIGDWTWPKSSTIEAVLDTLKNRIQRLDVEISNIDKEAEIYASSSEELGRLRREASIAEATYTVLIEQVKSQALVAGFKPETFRTYTYATPPLVASSPKTNLILAVSAIIGMLTGFTLAYLNAFRSGVFYSTSALLKSGQPVNSIRSKKLRQFSKKPISQIQTDIGNLISPELDEATIALSKSNVIFVINANSRISAAGMARVLAIHSGSTGKNVALIDMSQNQHKSSKSKDAPSSMDIKFEPPEFGVSILNVTDNRLKTSFFTSKVLQLKMKEFLSEFDQIFICTKDTEAFSRIRAMKQLNPTLVLLSRRKKTRKKYVQLIKQSVPIEVMFHE